MALGATGSAAARSTSSAPLGACDRLAATVVEADDIATCLGAGRRVVLADVTVRDTLDLRDVAVVSQPFACRNCTIEGDLLASDVTFQRLVDLSGTRIIGSLHADGAIFNGPFLFDTLAGTAYIRGDAIFTLAVFGDLADFAGTRFKGNAVFELAKFRSDAAFASTRFERGATFVDASFAGTAVFNRSRFAGPVHFREAAFAGRGAYREAEFAEMADFAESTFRGTADFTQAMFDGGAVFDNAQFVSNAVFLGTDFVEHNDLAASFIDAAASGDLDFSFAIFEVPPATATIAGGETTRRQATGEVGPLVEVTPQVASFAQLTSAGTVSFRNVFLEPGYALELNDLSAKGLVMSVGDAHAVADGSADATKPNQRHALELIQASAKADGQLGHANDAYFRLRVLVSRDYAWWHRDLDYLFYRSIAGYLVEPLNPLLTLLSLVGLLALVRALGGLSTIRFSRWLVQQRSGAWGVLRRALARRWHARGA